MSTTIETLQIRIGGKVEEALEGMNEIGVRAERLGKSLRRVGFRLTRNITLPLAAVGGASFKMAADFEQSMGRIEGLVGVQRSQLDAWRGDVRRLASEFGRSGAEAADALFFITSAGLRGDTAMETLEASLKGAAAGLGEVNTIADLATSVLNAYGEDTLSASQATDVLTAAVREGKLEPAELAGSMGDVIPIASAMGVQFNEVGAAMAAMSRTGTAAGKAAIQLRQFLNQLLKPAQGAEEAMAEVGLSAAGLRQQIQEEGLLSVLQTLRERTGGNQAQMARMIPNVRALSGVMNLMGSNADATAQIFRAMEDTSGDLDDALEDQRGSWFKLFQVVGETKRLLTEIGDSVLELAGPVFDFAADTMGRLADTVEGMSGPVKQFAVVFASLAAVVGPVALVLGRLIPLITQVGTTLVAGLTGPIGLTIAAVGSLGFAATTMIAHWEDVKLRMNLVWAAIKGAVFDGVDAILGGLERLASGIPFVGDKIKNLRERFNEFAESSLAKSGRKMAEIEAGFLAAGRAASEGGEGVTEFEQLLNELLDGTEDPSETVVKPIQDAVDELEDALAQATAMNDLLGSSFDLTEARASAYETAVRSLVDAGADFDAVVGPQGETLRELADRYLDLKSGIDEAAQAQRALEEAQREANAIAQRARTPVEEYRAEIANLREHLEAGRISQETFNRAMRQAKEDLDQAQRKAEAAGDTVRDKMESTAESAVDAFADFATGSGDAIEDFVQRALRDIARLIARMTILRALSLATPGGGFLASLIPGRAHGGPVRKRQPYVVGERGPELFVPQSSGRVVPNDQAQGGMDLTLEVNVPPARGPVDFTFARDAQWQAALSESIRTLRERGFDI